MKEQWSNGGATPDPHQPEDKPIPNDHPEPLHPEVTAAIRGGYGYKIIQNLDKFPNTDLELLATELFKYHQGHLISKNLDLFQTLDRQWLANHLVEDGRGDNVVENLEKFSGIDLQILADRVLQRGDGYLIAHNLDKFSSVDRSWLAQQLIEFGRSSDLINNLEKFPDLDLTELAESLIDNYESDLVVFYLGRFGDINRQWLANKLIRSGKSSLVLENLNEFPNVDLKFLAEHLFLQHKAYQVANHIEKFASVDQEWLADQIVEFLPASWIISNHEQLPKIDVKKLLQRVLADEPYLVYNRLEFFDSLDRHWLAEQLIVNQRGFVVVNNFEKFPGIDPRWLVEKLIDSNQGHTIFTHLQAFSGIDKTWFIEKLLQSNLADFIAQSIYWFFDVGGEKLVSSLIKTNNLPIEGATSLIPYLPLINAETRQALITKIYEKATNQDLLVELAEYQSPEALSQLTYLPRKIRQDWIKFYRENKFYKALLLTIENFDYGEVLADWTWEDVLVEIYSLIEQNNLDHARDLIACSLILFPDKSTEVENIQKTIGVSKTRPPIESRPSYEQLNCTNEIFKYYASLILLNKYQVKSLPPETQELALNSIETLFDKVREYILLAVSSEIQHSPEQRGVNCYGGYNHSLFQIAKSEDIRLFLERCAHNFNTVMKDEKIFGGPAWGTIADFGNQIWADDVETNLEKKIFLLNIIVAIQHNGGYFFDKDPKRVDLDSDQLKNLLDYEASGHHDLESFLGYGLEHQIIDQTDYDRFMGLESEISQNQSLVHLSPQLTKEHFSFKIESQIAAVLNNQDLPHEIKLSLSRYYSPEKGFARDLNSFSLLGRLLHTMNIQWQEVEGPVKKYQQAENIFYQISIEGYELGYWYQNGQLKIIKDVQEINSLTPQLADIFNTDIVKAQLGYLREGD